MVSVSKDRYDNIVVTVGEPTDELASVINNLPLVLKNAIFVDLKERGKVHVPDVEELGFDFYGCLPDRTLRYLKWVRADIPCIIPEYRTARLGVSIFATTLGENTKFALVQEKFGPTKGKWKLPTGSVKLGYEPHRTAEEELFEELNVRGTALHSVATFVDTSDSGFIDVCFLFILHVEDSELEKLAIQKAELADGRFVTAKEMESLQVTPFTKRCIEMAKQAKGSIFDIQRGPRKLVGYGFFQN